MTGLISKHKRTPLVDERSFELAAHFLQDESHTEEDKWSLADDIQKAVESWFEERERLAEARKCFDEALARHSIDSDVWDYMIMRWGQQHPRVCASNHPTGESINYGGRRQL